MHGVADRFLGGGRHGSDSNKCHPRDAGDRIYYSPAGKAPFGFGDFDVGIQPPFRPAFYLCDAPDVAITEAAVGAGVSTFIYVWAIHKTSHIDDDGKEES